MIASRFKLINKKGEGGFGSVFKAYDTETKKNVAIKLESLSSKNHLFREFRCYKLLHRMGHTHLGIPRIFWGGQWQKYRVLAMEYLGPSISKLFKYCGKDFSLSTVLILAVQMLGLVEFVHSMGILHRDIKPGNFAMGRGLRGNTLYLFDFGLSIPYLDRYGRHVPFEEDCGFHGSSVYASINTHYGYESCRRDDLESLGYTLVYLLAGSLPWSKVRGRQNILDIKQNTSLKDLCNGLPKEFLRYFEHLETIDFEEPPSYSYLNGLFKACMARHCISENLEYDWLTK